MSMFLEESFYLKMPQVLDIDPNGDVLLTLHEEMAVKEENVATEDSTAAQEQSQDKSKSCSTSPFDLR